jgi:hypothetical protein
MTWIQIIGTVIAIFLGISANTFLYEYGYDRAIGQKKPITGFRYYLLEWFLPFFILGYKHGLRDTKEDKTEQE